MPGLHRVSVGLPLGVLELVRWVFVVSLCGTRWVSFSVRSIPSRKLLRGTGSFAGEGELYEKQQGPTILPGGTPLPTEQKWTRTGTEECTRESRS
jgi:hypothetical protein